MTWAQFLASGLVTGFVFVFGLLVGSFLNVCISRWPLELSVIKPRSRCPKCKNWIAWYDNIPVLSWLVLGAKCRYCKTKIPWIYPGVELLTGFMFVLMWHTQMWAMDRYGLAMPTERMAYLALLIVGLLLVAMSIVVVFVDCERREIPDEISLNMMPSGVLLCFFLPQIMMQNLYFDITSKNPALHSALSQVYCDDWLHAVILSVSGVIMGGGVLWLLAIVGEKLLGKEVMGFGDVKLLAMLGGYLGPEGVLCALVIACCFGSIYGIIMKIITKDSSLPFGPWIVLGGILTFLLKVDIFRIMSQYIIMMNEAIQSWLSGAAA